MLRSFASVARLVGIAALASLTLFRAAPVVAQELPAGLLTFVAPVVANVVKAIDLTDDQKASIKKIIELHKDEIQAARESRDFMVLRQALRTVVQAVADVLTPEQREIAKDEIKKALGDRQLPQ